VLNIMYTMLHTVLNIMYTMVHTVLNKRNHEFVNKL
jgi:hypothetical protein